MGVDGNGTSANTEQDQISDLMNRNNIRIAVVGNVDAGKSTLIGTLTTSALDDGRGRSRTCIMRHKHEIESGRTSTAQTHMLGFKPDGKTISGAFFKDYLDNNEEIDHHSHGKKHHMTNAQEVFSRNARLVKSEDEIAREANKIVTLMDLAGHEKYLKTTIHGVSSGMADYALILVNSRHPPNQMTKHHLNLCCSFNIPVIIVLTKVDGCPEHALKDTTAKVKQMLRAPDVNKKPFMVKDEEDIIACIDKLSIIAPIIESSCVSAEGMDLLLNLMYNLPRRRQHEKKLNRPFEYLVEDIFNVPGVGAVVSGFVNAGELTLCASGGSNSAASVYVGPTDSGDFMKTTVKSIHVARIPSAHIKAGQSACLAFSLNKELRKKLRRGMVVLSDSVESPANVFSTKEFDAEICVMRGEGTTIRNSYQAFVHILNVRQSAFARKIELVGNSKPVPAASQTDGDGGLVLRPGSRAKVRFEFAKRPEYIRPGMRMLFRDGRVRGVGIITEIHAN